MCWCRVEQPGRESQRRKRRAGLLFLFHRTWTAAAAVLAMPHFPHWIWERKKRKKGEKGEWRGEWGGGGDKGWHELEGRKHVCSSVFVLLPQPVGQVGKNTPRCTHRNKHTGHRRSGGFRRPNGT